MERVARDLHVLMQVRRYLRPVNVKIEGCLRGMSTQTRTHCPETDERSFKSIYANLIHVQI